jgi:hypothetical protein
MNIFVFDIETIPDTESGRRIYRTDPSLAEKDVAELMFCKRREKTGHDFIAHHLQKVVALSVVFQHKGKLQVFTVGDEQSDEKTILTRFFQGIEKYSPMLVSWNGGGFDLPVLHYRALKHGITAARYWEKGDNDAQFKWNNYLSRYHYRHLDLMDVIAGFTPRANAPLDEIAAMCGFPGKMGINGGDVFSLYQAGALKDIRNYCETDVLNTYLVYLRFELMRGNLIEAEYEQLLIGLKTYLSEQDKPHFNEFLSLWDNQT